MKMKKSKAKNVAAKSTPTNNCGDLRVWHIPQIPGKAFIVPVVNVLEARIILDVLADYDAFQFDNNIKPDYSNAAGLSVFDDTDKNDGPKGSWVDWYSDQGLEIYNYTIDAVRKDMPQWEGVS